METWITVEQKNTDCFLTGRAYTSHIPRIGEYVSLEYCKIAGKVASVDYCWNLFSELTITVQLEPIS